MHTSKYCVTVMTNPSGYVLTDAAQRQVDYINSGKNCFGGAKGTMNKAKKSPKSNRSSNSNNSNSGGGDDNITQRI